MKNMVTMVKIREGGGEGDEDDDGYNNDDISKDGKYDYDPMMKMTLEDNDNNIKTR